MQLLCRSVLSRHVAGANLLLVLPGPRSGGVYNVGGGRQNSVSILETIDLLADMGHKLQYGYNPASGHP